MTDEDPRGPLILCHDGSHAAERSLGVAQGIAGGRIEAEELDAPAIVMGTRGLSGLKSAVLGSVAREVVNAYHRPVVLV